MVLRGENLQVSVRSGPRNQINKSPAGQNRGAFVRSRLTGRASAHHLNGEGALTKRHKALQWTVLTPCSAGICSV
jgi:hypothetical protein